MRRDVEQPPADLEWTTIDHVFVKAMCIKKSGTLIPQHSHAYDHGSFLAKGSVRLWKDGVLYQVDGNSVLEAPQMIHIAAGVKHTFQSLEDDTIVLCIHNTMRKEIVEILEEHQLERIPEGAV